MQAHHYRHDVLVLGLPDEFTPHGDPAQILASYGLNASGITQAVQAAHT